MMEKGNGGLLFILSVLIRKIRVIRVRKENGGFFETAHRLFSIRQVSD